MKNVYSSDVVGTMDAGTYEFSTNKDFYKEVTTPLLSSSGMTFEYEVNPVKPDGHHYPTFSDNEIVSPLVTQFHI